MTATDSDEEAFLGYGMALVGAVDAAFEPWLRAIVERFVATTPTVSSDIDTASDKTFDTAIDSAIAESTTRAHELLVELANADVELPLSGPLERLRQAVQPLTLALSDHGVAKPRRDPVDAEMRPDDLYGIGPHTFLDLGDEVHAAGISWGAAKAHMHMQRRRVVDAAQTDDESA